MRKLISCSLIVLTIAVLSSAAVPRKLLETTSSDNSWELDMAALDSFVVALGNEPNSIGYLFIYAGQREHPREFETRRRCINSYLVNRRGVERGRVRILRGGHREQTTLELWIVPPGETAPKPSPTVLRKNVKLLKTRSRYHCDI